MTFSDRIQISTLVGIFSGVLTIWTIGGVMGPIAASVSAYIGVFWFTGGQERGNPGLPKEDT